MVKDQTYSKEKYVNFHNFKEKPLMGHNLKTTHKIDAQLIKTVHFEDNSIEKEKTVSERYVTRSKKQDTKSTALKIFGVPRKAKKGGVNLSMNNETNSQLNKLLNEVQRIIENIYSSSNKNLKIIGITSAVSNEGTTTLSGLMSLIAAERLNNQYQPIAQNNLYNSHIDLDFILSKKKGTLLIDTHFRKPALQEKFDVSMSHGFYEILSNKNSLQASIKIVSPSLRLITAGHKSDVPLTQTDIQKLKSFLDEIKFQFDFIFLDIPPILHYAEGIGLSKLCDGVVIDVCAGNTRWELVSEAKRLLEKAEVNILGAVLNKRKYLIPESIYHKL